MNILKPESYLSPILLSYLSKYIEDIEAKNLNLSVWGGDAVLNNLKFKLDVLDNELGSIPFSFVSCQAQELTIHVPWNKLTSESVVVTLNTVECVLKLNCEKTVVKTVKKEQKVSETAQQRSYIETLIRKIKRNVIFNINNLIIKYVEDDIVYSININTLTYKPCNKSWSSSFIDLSENEPFLHYLCKIEDLTICLDKLGKNGNIDNFEEPMLFRCCINIRQHFKFDSFMSKKPSVNKIDFKIDQFHLSISKKQLPSVLHLLKLCIYLYYKKLETNHTITVKEDEKKDEEDKADGWASWAWSMVPPIMSYEESIDNVNPLALSINLYIKNFSLTLKDSGSIKNKHFFHKNKFRPGCLCQVQMEGISVELFARGVELFTCNFCVSLAKLVCGTKTIDLNTDRNDSSTESFVVASAGVSTYKFADTSLFDPRSPENNEESTIYKTSKEQFINFSPSETSSAFASKYFYSTNDGRSEEDKEETKFNNYLGNLCLTDFKQWHCSQERSYKHLNLGGENFKFYLSSHTINFFNRLILWSKTEHIKEYNLKPLENVEVVKDVLQMKPKFIPTRSTLIDLGRLELIIFSSHLISSNSPKSFLKVSNDISYSSRHENMNEAVIPCSLVVFNSMRFKISQPMYGTHLSALISGFLAPSKESIKACYTTYDLDIASVNCYLSSSKLESSINLSFEQIESFLNISGISIQHDKLEGELLWNKNISMISNQSKLFVKRISTKTCLLDLEIFLHLVDSWLFLFKPEVKANKLIDMNYLLGKYKKSRDIILLSEFENIIVESATKFSYKILGGALQSLKLFWDLNNIKYPFLQSSCLMKQKTTLNDFKLFKPNSCNKSFTTNYNEDLWSNKTHCISFVYKVPNEENLKTFILFNTHCITFFFDLTVLSSLLSCYHMYPSYIMPSVFEYLESTDEAKTLPKNNNSSIKLPLDISKTVLQVETEGLQVFVLKTNLKFSPQYKPEISFSYLLAEELIYKDCKDFKIWSVNFPAVVALTAGYKKVDLESSLIKTGLKSNISNDIQTLNIGFETCEAFSICCDSSHKDLGVFYDQVLEPFQATCTIACSKQMNEAVNTCLQIHLDVDPVVVSVNCKNLLLQASLIKYTLNFFKEVFHKYSKKANLGLQDLEKTVSMTTTTASEGRIKSKLETNIVKNKNIKPSCLESLWLQCTISRIDFNLFDDSSNFYKTTCSLEDISFSLDKKPVFLKLICSFNSCKLNQYAKFKEKESSCLDGISLQPIYSEIPSFVRADGFDSNFFTLKSLVNSNKNKLNDEKRHGKFVEFTYTKCDVDDWHKKMYPEKSKVNTLPTTEDLNKHGFYFENCLHEVIFSVQPFDVIGNPKAVEDLISSMFTEVLDLFKSNNSDEYDNSINTKSFKLPRIHANINGFRLFVPLVKKNNDCKDFIDNNVLILCVSSIKIDPNPENSLTRVVVSSKVFETAHSLNLFNVAGCCVENLQFQCLIEDMCVGFSKSSAIVKSIELSKPCDNPALHWNKIGNIELGALYYPLLDHFDLIAIYAPPINFLKASSNKKVYLCAKSLEINVLSDLVLYCSKIQLMFLENASSVFDKFSLKKRNSNIKFEDFNDTTTSNLEESSSKTNSYLHVKPAKTSLMGEYFVSGKNVIFNFYNTLEESLQYKFKPMLVISLIEPSFCLKISKREEQILFHLHDCIINTYNSTQGASSNLETIFESSATGFKSRNGVPPSFFEALVTNCLTKKAEVELKIKKNLKLLISELLVKNTITFLHDIITVLNIPKDSFVSTPEKKRQSSSLNFQRFCFEAQNISLTLVNQSASFKISLCKPYINQTYCDSKIIKELVIKSLNFSLTDLKLSKTVQMISPFQICMEYSEEMFCLVSDRVRNLKLKFLPVNIDISPNTFKLVQGLVNTCNNWKKDILKTFMKLNSRDKTVISSSTSFESKDELRLGLYEYVCAENENEMPLSNQIMFFESSDYGVMSWSFRQPAKITNIKIVPLMFNDVSNNQNTSVSCELQRYNEFLETFEIIQSFCLYESQKVNLVLSNNNEGTSWRIVVNKTFLPIKMLAANTVVDCTFDSKDIPSLLIHLQAPNLCISLSENSNNYECLKMKIKNFDVSLRNSKNSLTAVVKPTLDFSIFLIDYEYLTWMPLLEPFKLGCNISYNLKSFTIFANILETIEVKISQKLLKSVKTLANVWTCSNNNFENISIKLQNTTDKLFYFGQNMRNESIELKPFEEVFYTWNSKVFDPKLHLLYNNIWSEPFSVTNDKSEIVRYFTENEFVLITISTTESLQKIITVSSCLSFTNKLPFDLNLKVISVKSTFKSYLKSEQTKECLIFADLVQKCCINEKQVANYNHFNKRTRNFIEIFNNESKCFVQMVFEKEAVTGKVKVFFLPVFLLRSHLPSKCTVHIENKLNSIKHQVEMKGCGSKSFLTNLDTALTYHLSVQLSDESPFDAAIPIKGTLLETLSSIDYNSSFDYENNYPYSDSTNYKTTDESWECKEGSIKVRLSLSDHSLLIEITPWLLINNKTYLNLKLCSKLTEGINETTLYSNQTVVPQHFTSSFAIQAFKSMKSKWFDISKDISHPSRSDSKQHTTKVWHESTNVIHLRKESCVIDLLMSCSIRFGIFIVDITPLWFVLNTSTKLSSIMLYPLIGEFFETSKSNSNLEISNENLTPILHWNIMQGRVINSESIENLKKVDPSITSLDKKSKTVLYYDESSDRCSRVYSLKDRSLAVFYKESSFISDLKNEFVRSVYHFETADNEFVQVLLTRELYNNKIYLVFSEVEKHSLTFSNLTNFEICIKEDENVQYTAPELVLPAKATEVKYESVKISQTFPYLKAKAPLLNFNIRLLNEKVSTIFSLSLYPGKYEVVFDDGLVLWCLVHEFNSVLIEFYEDESCSSNHLPVNAITKQSICIKTKMNSFRIVCFDDVSYPLYSLDILQISIQNILLELDNNQTNRSSSLCFIFDDIQFDTHVSTRYPVLLTSKTLNSDSKEKSFALILNFKNIAELTSIDIKVKPLELMGEQNFFKIVANLVDSYSKVFLHEFSLDNEIRFVDFIKRSSQTVCQSLQLTRVSINAFEVLLTLNASFKLNVTLHKGSISFTKFKCVKLNCRWSDLVEEGVKHYIADAVLGAGWVFGSADIIGNPLTTVKNVHKGIKDFVLMPYVNIGRGPSAFVLGLSSGISSLLKNVSYGLLQSVTGVATAVSRNIEVLNDTEDEKNIFFAEVPGVDDKIFLPHKYHESQRKNVSYMRKITKSVTKVVTKPLSSASSIVSKVGGKIITGSGLSLENKHLHFNLSHKICSYETSKKKFQERAAQFLEVSECSLTCLFVLKCYLKNTSSVERDQSTRFWLISNKGLFIFQPDDTVEFLENIDHLVTVTNRKGNISFIKYTNDCIEEDSSVNDKVVSYLEEQHSTSSELSSVEVVNVEDTVVSEYCVIPFETRQAAIFQVIFNSLINEN